MPERHKQCSLLEELDKRQDEVLAGLDELNGRVEQLLEECLRSRKEEIEAALKE